MEPRANVRRDGRLKLRKGLGMKSLGEETTKTENRVDAIPERGELGQERRLGGKHAMKDGVEESQHCERITLGENPKVSKTIIITMCDGLDFGILASSEKKSRFSR